MTQFARGHAGIDHVDAIKTMDSTDVLFPQRGPRFVVCNGLPVSRKSPITLDAPLTAAGDKGQPDAVIKIFCSADDVGFNKACKQRLVSAYEQGQFHSDRCSAALPSMAERSEGAVHAFPLGYSDAKTRIALRKLQQQKEAGEDLDPSSCVQTVANVRMLEKEDGTFLLQVVGPNDVSSDLILHDENCGRMYLAWNAREYLEVFTVLSDSQGWPMPVFHVESGVFPETEESKPGRKTDRSAVCTKVPLRDEPECHAIRVDHSDTKEEFIPIDDDLNEAIKTSNISLKRLFEWGKLREAVLQGELDWALIHELIHDVQNKIPFLAGGVLRIEKCCLSFHQFVAFARLMHDHIKSVRWAPARLNSRILELSHCSVNIVITSNRKCMATVAVIQCIDNAPTSAQMKDVTSLVHLISWKQQDISDGDAVAVELDALVPGTDYFVYIYGEWKPQVDKPAVGSSDTDLIKSRLKIRTLVEPEHPLFILWDEMDNEGKKNELLAVIKDKKVKDEATKSNIDVPVATSISVTVDLQQPIWTNFVAWWVGSPNVRQQFCEREVKHALRDVAIQAAAEREGISVKHGDWIAIDSESRSRWKKFIFWYFGITSTNSSPDNSMKAIHIKSIDKHCSTNRRLRDSAANKNVPVNGTIEFPSTLERDKESITPRFSRRPCAVSSLSAYIGVKHKKEIQNEPDVNVDSYESSWIRCVGVGKGGHNEDGNTNIMARQNTMLLGTEMRRDRPNEESNGESDINVTIEETKNGNEMKNTVVNEMAHQTRQEDPKKPIKLNQQNATEKETNDLDPSKVILALQRGSRGCTAPPTLTSDLSDLEQHIERKVSFVDHADVSRLVSYSRFGSVRSRFLHRKISRWHGTVHKIDNMLSSEKGLKGIALFREKARMVTIAQRFGSQRNVATASELANIDLFDDFGELGFDAEDGGRVLPKKKCPTIVTQPKKNNVKPKPPEEEKNQLRRKVAELRKAYKRRLVLKCLLGLCHWTERNLLIKYFSLWSKWEKPRPLVPAVESLDKSKKSTSALELEPEVQPEPVIDMNEVETKDKSSKDNTEEDPKRELIEREFSALAAEDCRSLHFRKKCDVLIDPKTAKHPSDQLFVIPSNKWLRDILGILPGLAYKEGSGLEITENEYEEDYAEFLERSGALHTFYSQDNNKQGMEGVDVDLHEGENIFDTDPVCGIDCDIMTSGVISQEEFITVHQPCSVAILNPDKGGELSTPDNEAHRSEETFKSDEEDESKAKDWCKLILIKWQQEAKRICEKNYMALAEAEMTMYLEKEETLQLKEIVSFQQEADISKEEEERERKKNFRRIKRMTAYGINEDFMNGLDDFIASKMPPRLKVISSWPKKHPRLKCHGSFTKFTANADVLAQPKLECYQVHKPSKRFLSMIPQKESPQDLHGDQILAQVMNQSMPRNEDNNNKFERNSKYDFLLKKTFFDQSSVGSQQMVQVTLF